MVRALLLERLGKENEAHNGISVSRGSTMLQSQQLVEALALIMSATGEHRRSLELRVALTLAAKRSMGHVQPSRGTEWLSQAVENIFAYMEKYQLQTIV